MKKSKKPQFSNSIWTMLIIGLFGFFAIAIIYKMTDMGYLNRSGRTIPVYDDVPDFMLTDQNGKDVTKEDLFGHVWVADFIFTRCAGQCPIMSLAVSKLLKEMPDLRCVSFTSDPEYDSPQVLLTYAGWYSADPQKWLFLTGSKNGLNQVASGLKLTKIDDPSLHSNYLVLIDKKNRIRGYYDPNDAKKLDDLKKDVKSIL